MEKSNFPERLKQSKISAFCSSRGNGEGCVGFRGLKKRKNDAEVSEACGPPAKRAARSDSVSPPKFHKSSDRISHKNGILEGTGDENRGRSEEDFLLDDFENDPFLSPRKKESPKKSILGEKFLVNEILGEEKSELSFETPVTCTVLQATLASEKCFEKVLLLRDRKLEGKGVCRLRDVWASLSVCTDDVVSIQATLCEGSWVVDNRGGFVVLHPDTLVSTTALVGSMFCMRRGILASYFKEMDSEEGGKMVIGRLVHELFQESLKREVRSDEELAEIAAEFLQSRDNLHDIFLSNKDIVDIEVEMKKFIPSLRNFLQVYVDKRLEPTGRNFRGTIESVVDIEELVKSPALGFQGRVDVTVRVRSKKVEKIAPLELKTGRASFSNEHRSQLALYILMMNELGRKVESGLLLYLRENVMEEIVPGRDDIRNLLLLRNHFVGFCKNMGKCSLPEPIRNVKFCAKCSHLRICTAYLKGGEGEKVGESHPIRSLELADLKPSHVDYFLRWTQMLWVEFEEVEGTKDDSQVLEVRLEPNVERYRGQFKHEFVTVGSSKGGSKGGSEGGALRSGTFVHVMDGRDKRMCLGEVVDVRESRIYIVADKQLTHSSDALKLVVFKWKSLNVYLSNLGWFLRDEFKSLRELIIDKRMPRFEKNLDKADFQEKCLKNLLNLNKDQQKAILKSLLCHDYLLVKGPPGTGKTQTIVALVKTLLALNKTVLVASHSNSAVDNILLKLDGVQYLRLGSARSIHENVRKNSYATLKETCSTVGDIRKLFERKLIASTCMGIDATLVARIRVEFCILDESSQILQAEALRPLLCCRKFVLVGDENQLPPVVRKPQAKALGMCQSLFARLENEKATVSLRLQYRMNSVINALANAITYEGLVECADEGVARGTMRVTEPEEYRRAEEWVAEALSTDLGKSLVFVDTSECLRARSGEYRTEPRRSLLEANIVVRLVRSLLKLGLEEDGVGVISPFWDQVTLLRKKLAEEGAEGIEVNTVDQYQGRDKEVILLSCTKENRSDKDGSEQELLSDERRLTVAVTRAKHKLIILGDKETLVRYEPGKKLVRSLKEAQFLCLSDGEKGFVWENFVK